MRTLHICTASLGGGFLISSLPRCLSSQHEKYTSQLQLGIKSQEAKSKEKHQLQSSEKSKDAVSDVKLEERADRKAQSLTGRQ